MRFEHETATQLCAYPGHEIRSNMDLSGRRLLSYLRPGFLIEYEMGLVRHLAIVLEIDRMQRYGLSEIRVISSCPGHTLVYVKDITAVIALDNLGVLYL
jgi:hypothetical protein